MKRRALLVLAGSTLATRGFAQAPGVLPHIGFMYSGSATSDASKRVIGTLKQGLADNGLVEGRDYVFDVLYADGDYQRFPEMARALAQACAKAIFASTIPS